MTKTLKNINNLLKSISIYTSIKISIFLFLLASCNAETERKANLTAPMLEKFNAQDQRFELSGCINYYNGKEFSLDMSIDENIDAFGPPVDSHYHEKKERNAYFWSNDRISIYQDSKTSEIYGILINLKNFDNQSKPFYVVVDDIPLEKDMTMGEFASLSSLGFSKFKIGRSDYKLTFNNCDRAITYRFHSQINHQYHGGGHLQMRGDADLTVTHPVKYIYIEYTSL